MPPRCSRVCVFQTSDFMFLNQKSKMSYNKPILRSFSHLVQPPLVLSLPTTIFQPLIHSGPRVAFYSTDVSLKTPPIIPLPLTHTPVLLNEILKYLQIKPNALYIDATFGEGGYTQAILDSNDSCRVIALDQDWFAVKRGRDKLLERYK